LTEFARDTVKSQQQRGLRQLFSPWNEQANGLTSHVGWSVSYGRILLKTQYNTSGSRNNNHLHGDAKKQPTDWPL